MGVKARLKFRDPMPFQTEQMMIKELGFTVQARRFNEYIVLEKRRPFEMGTKKPAHDGVTLPTDPVPKVEQFSNTLNDRVMLGRACNAIKNKFHDPAANKELIRFRIQTMAKSLTPVNRIWCEGWIERNINAL